MDGSFLTKKDIEFLVEEEEIPNAQMRRNRRAGIRSRTLRALRDIPLLNRYLEPRDRRQVNKDVEDEINSLLDLLADGLVEYGEDYREVVAEVYMLMNSTCEEIVFETEEGREVYKREDFESEIDTDEYFLSSNPIRFERFDYDPNYLKKKA